MLPNFSLWIPILNHLKISWYSNLSISHFFSSRFREMQQKNALKTTYYCLWWCDLTSAVGNCELPESFNQNQFQSIWRNSSILWSEMASMTAAEYSDSVREWLVQAYQWQAFTYCKFSSEMFYIHFRSKMLIWFIFQLFQVIWHIKLVYSSSNRKMVKFKEVRKLFSFVK